MKRPVCLVTGAARRIGKAIALAMAKAGYDLIIHCHRSIEEGKKTAQLCEEYGQAHVFSADLASTTQIQAMFSFVDETYGRLDALINSAAVFFRHPPNTLTVDDLDETLQINLRAPYLCSTEAASRMRTQQGCIVNLADIAAERPFSNHIPYCISKAGLVMMTRSMAKAFAPQIRVNAINLGTVLFRDDEGEALRKHIISRIPMGTIGSPEDVAETVVFLCTGPTHITGAVIPIDGGRSLV